MKSEKKNCSCPACGRRSQLTLKEKKAGNLCDNCDQGYLFMITKVKGSSNVRN
jgi:transcription elongation factor Elf1